MSSFTKLAFAALIFVSISATAGFASDEESNNSPDLKGRVNNGVTSSSASEVKEPAVDIYLRVHIESFGKNGRNFEVEPFYMDPKKTSSEEFFKFVGSPLAQKRIALWKDWYSRLFEELTDELTVPKGLREKISIMVNKDKKLTATQEWIDPSDNQEVPRTAKQLLTKIRNLSGSEWLEFPEKSYLELVTVQLYLGDEGVHLDNDTQKLDCD